MESYVFLNRFDDSGDLGLSKKVFISLGEHAIDSVKQVYAKTNKKGIDLNDPINVLIKNNRVYYKFSVKVEKDVDHENVKNSIIDIVTTNLIMLCDALPFNIEVKIKEID